MQSAGTAVASASKSGWMNARKNSGKSFTSLFAGAWKRRFVSLTGTELAMYKEENYAEVREGVGLARACLACLVV